MTWLVEDPWTIGFVVLAIGVIALVMAAQISHGAMVLAVVMTVLAAAGLLLTERLVVTEKERVEETLYRAADAVMSGDSANVLPLFAPQASAIRDQLKILMSTWQIEEVKLADMKITINRLTPQPSARAAFRARVEGSSRRRNVLVSHNQVLQQMIVTLEEQPDGRWLIAGYDIGG